MTHEVVEGSLNDTFLDVLLLLLDCPDREIQSIRKNAKEPVLEVMFGPVREKLCQSAPLRPVSFDKEHDVQIFFFFPFPPFNFS